MNLLYLELNQHTGEQRLHTATSFMARLKATGTLAMLERRRVLVVEGQIPPLPIETKHAIFRLKTRRDFATRIPAALETGAWGRVAQERKINVQKVAA